MPYQGSSAGTRRRNADRLVKTGRFTEKDADGWVNCTADSAQEIEQWRKAGYQPEEARSIYAIAYENDEEPIEWRDLGLPVEVTIGYVEAGYSIDEAREFEAADTRPDQGSFDMLRAFHLEENVAAVRQFKADLRADSAATADEDWILD